MEHPRPKSVLFLCTGNYYRSRFAEILFNSVAQKMGLSWRATSRGLALEWGVNNVGPIAPSVRQALETLGISAADACERLPMQAVSDDFQGADRVIALKQTEHLPLLQERFSAWAEQVEFWHIDDAMGALTLIEREVMELAARLIGGGPRQSDHIQESALEVCPGCRLPAADCTCRKKSQAGRGKPVVRVSRETKGRRGKGVTIVADLPLDEDGLRDLAARLKQRCGSGGTVKDGRIEIQGDQRDRLAKELDSLGYRVVRVG